MANIKAPVSDVLAKMATVPGIVYVNIWNNQVSYEGKGLLYDFPKPALFLETVNKVAYQEIGLGFKTADVCFRVHLVHEFYDSQDGGFEKNLPVFDFAAAVDLALSFYEPTGCGTLIMKGEGQDYEHTNIYHYVLEFVCNFINSTASPYDPANGGIVSAPAPTLAQINGSYETPTAQPRVHQTVRQSPQQFNIPK